METQNLIARYMLENYPFTIAKKNWYKEKSSNPFRGWCLRDKIFTDTTKRKADEDVARKCEDFLHNIPLAFLFCCQLDMGKPAWKAWRSSYLIATSISPSNFNPHYLSTMSKDLLIVVLEENKLGCRNLTHDAAARNIIELAKLITKKYDGKALNIWEAPKSFIELRDNLIAIPGFGPGLTNMCIKILLELGMLTTIPKDSHSLRQLQVKADIHVKKVLYRTGLAEEETEKSAYEAAIAYSYDCPMSLDIAGFAIGQKYCFKTDPNCDDCPVGTKKDGSRLCPRIGI